MFFLYFLYLPDTIEQFKLNSRVDDIRKIAKTSEKWAKYLPGPLVELSN